MRYNYEWDYKKAVYNLNKHGVSFERASSAFCDPRAISIYDKGHSVDEERWITLGLDRSGVLVVVAHTFVGMTHEIKIRIISARKATKKETSQYLG